MAVAAKIAAALGIERAEPGDVALALAHAYGEAIGLYAMTGVSQDALAGIGKVYCEAVNGAVSRIHASDCEGSA